LLSTRDELKMPRACPVEFSRSLLLRLQIQAEFFTKPVADIVKLNGTSPWHLLSLPTEPLSARSLKC
jgi:hypothetical protein